VDDLWSFRREQEPFKLNSMISPVHNGFSEPFCAQRGDGHLSFYIPGRALEYWNR